MLGCNRCCHDGTPLVHTAANHSVLLEQALTSLGFKQIMKKWKNIWKIVWQVTHYYVICCFHLIYLICMGHVACGACGFLNQNSLGFQNENVDLVCSVCVFVFFVWLDGSLMIAILFVEDAFHVFWSWWWTTSNANKKRQKTSVRAPYHVVETCSLVVLIQNNHLWDSGVFQDINLSIQHIYQPYAQPPE